MRRITLLPLAQINMDRWPLHPRTLMLVEHFRKGGTVPPIHVQQLVRNKGFRYKWRGRYKILDGRHRITATKLLGRTHILAKFADGEYHGS